MDGRIVGVSGEGYSPKGKFIAGGKEISVKDVPGLSLLLKIAVLCDTQCWKWTGINGFFRCSRGLT